MAYGNQGMSDEALARMDRTKSVTQHDPFFGEGNHLVAVVSLENFDHKEHGPSVRGTFEILESATHKVGTSVVKLWNLMKKSKFESQATDADKFADFVLKLKNAPQGYDGVARDIRALLRDNTSKKADKPYVDVRWTAVATTPEVIAANRQRIESQAPAATPMQAPPTPAYQPAPQYAPPPAPPQGGFLAQLPGTKPQGGGQGGW